MRLLPFQNEFLECAFAQGIRTSALSLPRGNGKSTLVAHLAARFLTPGDPLHVEGAESHIVAASIGQARRTVFKQLRGMVGDDPRYRVAESVNNVHIDHKATRTRLSVLAANGKTAQGLVDVPYIFADEPGAWTETGGSLVWDAIETAQGKPGNSMRVLICGTLAPATSGWWHDLIRDGSEPGRHVSALIGNSETWENLHHVHSVNPLMSRFPESRAVLRSERDKALGDTRLKARFISYRLNHPTADESEVLLTVSDWNRVCARPEGLPAGAPVVGIDLGAGRAWSAAVAIWQSGRLDAIAVAPGVPDLAAQERRDRVSLGTYQRLHDAGCLRVAAGLRVQPVADLVQMIRDQWGEPDIVLCDRFRLADLQDAAPNWTIVPRVTRWSEASEDIRALRKMALDGPLSCPRSAQPLVTAALSSALVQNDDAGNSRLVKRGTNNQARDDVAAALTLAAGQWARDAANPPQQFRYFAV